MPSNKKKSTAEKKKKQEERQAKQKEAGEIHTHASKFRDLLQSGRKDYSKGRSYEAVELYNEALAFGSRKLPRFNDNSLVKGHALLELALAKSAIQTDFATGEEWEKTNKEFFNALSKALKIFENRESDGTLTKFRKDECWFDASGEYVSPVPHTERLGPVDYMSCVNFVGHNDPTPDTVRSIKRAMAFVNRHEANGCAIRLEGGVFLQGQSPIAGAPGGSLGSLEACLREHEAVVSGQKTKVDVTSFVGNSSSDVERRHAGSRLGGMKQTHKKLDKDIDRIGLKKCENHNCENFESHPRQFPTCSRCSWAAYCSRDCQASDWKRHKKECKSGEASKKENEAQNATKNCLMVGQSQRVLTIIAYLHHFAVTSAELQETRTEDAARVMRMVKPKLDGIELGSFQMGMQEVAFTWNAIWSMTKQNRNKMIRKFLREMRKFSFPTGGPEFTVVTEWGLHGVSGDFAIVENTPKGTILLHEDTEKGDIKAYLAVGITQSIESLLSSAPSSTLPMHVNTALIPYKKLVLCQGIIVPSLGVISNKLHVAANGFINNGGRRMKVIESMSL